MVSGWHIAAGAAEPAIRSPVGGGISVSKGNFVVLVQDTTDQEFEATPDASPIEQQFIGDDALPNGFNDDLSFEDSAAALTETFAPISDTVSGSQGDLMGANDSAQLLQYASSVKTVEVQRRSPVSFDPRIRGYRLGQVYALYDSAYYFPVRQDLDTMLSKFDPSLIDAIVVIPGPYAVRYGPGFSFLDVIGTQTPRYQNGHESHSRTGMTYHGNGEQLYGRETIYGGGADYGYIMNYGNRNGSDYRSGGDTIDIPATYHNRNYLGQFGFDLSPEDSVEVKYNRLDQSDTEYPGQFFDVRFLTTDATSVNFVHADESSCWTRFAMSGWYNRTRFAGDTYNESKDTFNVIPRVEAALGEGANTFFGDTSGDLISSGARMSATYGQVDDTQLTVGTDLHYLEQNIREQFVSRGNVPFTGINTVNGAINTNLPRSFWLDPGVFTELSIPVQSYWTTTVGARTDFSRTSLREDDVRTNTSLAGTYTQSDMLWAAYLTNQVDLARGWIGRFGIGYAERPPTLLERYADGVFVGLIQSGFSRVVGTPELDKERNTQIDVSLEADYCCWRGKIGGFHGWVNDYITYQANRVVDPTGAQVLNTVNTDLATISGAEVSGEYDLNRRWTVFSSARYIYGRDQEINAPLPGIYPFDSRFGVRLQDPCGGKRWGSEFFVRAVNDQDQLGDLRITNTSVIDTFESRTPGFTVYNIRGYYNVNDNFNIIGGIDNLFDKQYLEHLDLRIAAQPVSGRTDIPQLRVLSPGFSPYVGAEWTY
ncbi:MAG: TonB-dependent receptor [Planctomycetia bacterium]|nr:TonB-dependent receptor [Planctomycetia bacterium]